MQDVNNDMDDLFRKAAEHYPLKTDGADWQKIIAGLQNASLPPQEKDRRKRRLLWLWLLLPLALLWAVYYNASHQPVQQTAAAKNFINEDENGGNSQKINGKQNNQSSSTIENKDTEKSAFPSAAITGSRRLPELKGNPISVGHESKRNGDKSKIQSHSSATPVRIESEKKNADDKQVSVTFYKDIGVDKNKKNSSALQPGDSSDRMDKRVMTDNERTIEATQSQTNNEAAVNTKEDSLANNNMTNENKSKLVKTKPRTQNGFYTGLLASFDISTIKLQRINKTGYGLELLIGYRFSKRVSVESGIGLTDKKYYSVGKYFDKTRTDISPDSKIIYTNGSCVMFEIPATVKYDFAQKKKSNLFATAGLSSYIMKDETYSYYANHSGNYYSATKKYSRSGSNLFSVASLSVGYQLQISKHLSLRAEPYIKIPLSGIGIARMPITSTGITAGFVRSF